MLKPGFRFRKDRRGVAAVEFGLIAPVLATMLLGTIEVCNALQCKQKVTSIASSVADLVAQTKSVSASDMTNIFSAANALIYPFSSANSGIVVSSIVSDGNGNGTVAWSQAQNATPLTVGTAVTVPTGLMSSSQCPANACSVILATVNYQYTSPLGKIITGTNTMSDYFYAHPRKSATVSYTN
ncbi:MAG TPA: TadE/TadG family type IV pilus assembly protein [Rhizomicrobium sp.]|nr:TadE/TadG family type IV pilus assembly protein [Rhizomicrobium sp.]